MEDLRISEYRMLLEQALNLGNLFRQGEFKMQNEDEQQETLKDEYNKLVKEGKIPWLAAKK